MLVKKEKKSCLGKPCRKLKNSAFEGFFFLFAVCGSNQGKAEAGCGEWVELRDRAQGADWESQTRMQASLTGLDLGRRCGAWTWLPLLSYKVLGILTGRL